MIYNQKINFQTIDVTKEDNFHDKLNKMTEELQYLKSLNLEDLDNYIDFNDVIINLVSLQDETGAFPLLTGEAIPNDAFYWSVKEPTYIILKLLCEYNNPLFYPNIKKALYFCKKSKFRGHGYDVETCQLDNLTMLMKVDFLDFVDDELRELVYDIIHSYRRRLACHQTSTGWGSMEKNIKELLRVVDKNNVIFYGTLLNEEVRDSLCIDAYEMGFVSLPDTEIITKDNLSSLSFRKGYESLAMVYEVGDIDMEILDKFEGHKYIRKELFLSNGNIVYKVNAYLFKELANEFEREMY